MTQNQSIRKILPIVLAVALMLTLLPGITLAATSTVDITGLLSVPAVQTAIQSNITSSVAGDTVIVIGSFSGAAATLTLNIPAGVTVEWHVPFYIGSASPLMSLSGNGTFEVTGDVWLENTGVGNTINALGNDAAVIVSNRGTVKANSGSAIDASGLNATVTIISMGSVSNDATTNIRPALHMSNVNGFNTTIIIDRGSVAALNPTASDYAIQTYGDIEITNGSHVYTESGIGRAINALGPTSTVTISGKPPGNLDHINTTVWAVGGIAIRTNSIGAHIILKDDALVYNEGANDNYPVIFMENGGTVTVQDNSEVEARSTGTGIKTNGTVIVTDDGRVTAKNGQAIRTSGAGSGTIVEGGLVFAYGSGITGTGSNNVTNVMPDIPAPGMVVAWDITNTNQLTLGSSTALTIAPSSPNVTAVWAIVDGKSGIRYRNDLDPSDINEGFYPIEGITLNVPFVPVTGVDVDPETMELLVGNYDWIDVIFTSPTPTNQIVTWESDNMDVASVLSDGMVTGLSPGIANITVTTVDGSYTATCVVTVSTLIITANAGTGGSIEPSGNVPVSYLGNRSFTIIADPGYDISSVTVDGTALNPIEASYTFYNIISNGSTIEALFEPIVDDGFTITASAGTGGSISPSGEIPVDSGSSQTFTITADSGYDISAVFVDGVDEGPISSYTFTNIDDDHTIEAYFELNDTGNNGGSGGKGGSGTGGATVNESNTSDKPRENENNGSNSSSNSNTYIVIQHFGQYAGSGDSEGIIDGSFDKFIRLLYEGQEVDPDNYTVTETDGNVVITLKESYAQTFDAGTHTFLAEFTDGYADLILTIENGGSDDSGKTSTSWTWIWLLVLLLILIILVILYKRWRPASS